MAKRKRIVRKELLKGPDEFVSFWARAIQFAVDNQRPISYVLGGLLVVVLAFSAYRYFSALSERKAYTALEQGLAHYMSQASGEESSSSEDAAKQKFAEVLDKYSSTRAAQLSLPLYADLIYQEGSYDKAIELYQEALDIFSNEDGLRKHILNGIAYAYEGKKDYKTAAQYFQKITESKGKFLKEDACFNLARMYEAAGDSNKAREAYNALVRDYPQSANFRMAREKVRRLTEQE